METNEQKSVESWVPSKSEESNEAIKERLSKLRRERAAIQGAFTKTEHLIQLHLDSTKSESKQIDEQLHTLRRIYDNLVEKVKELLDLTCDSEAESEKLQGYAETMGKKMNEVEDKVKTWYNDQIKPTDSASQIGGSKCSTTASRAAAKKAALKIQAEALRKTQAIKQQKLKLEQEEEMVRIEAEIAAAEVEEEFLSFTSRKSSARSHPVVKRSPELDIIELMHLPKSELIKFDGNPAKYWSFVRAFDNSIGCSHLSESAKLNRLLQFCIGEARDVIECCVAMNPDEGYMAARGILEKRFGNPFVIAKVWIEKVTEGPNPTGPHDLMKYADNIRSCVMTLTAMGRTDEIENKHMMQKIVTKLPVYMQGGWRKQAVQHLKAHGRYPDIESLASFIQNAAEELNDPVFGIPQSRPQATKPLFKKTPATNFNISGSSGDQRTPQTPGYKACRFCNGGHPLYRCHQFRGISLKERKEFVTQKKLCTNCFSSLHPSNRCNKNSFCNVEGCKSVHSNLMHEEEKPQASNTRSKGGRSQTEALQMNASVSKETGSRTALPIVPIVVRSNKSNESVTTLALLDPGSTNTFCSRELAEQLQLECRDTTLCLNTLTKQNERSKTPVTSVTVSDTSGHHVVDMSNVFVIPKIPEMKDSIVTRRDIENMEHMRDLQLPVLHGRVSMLIGQDNPLILAPLDVRKGGPKDPYATRTVFGWTVNGPLQGGRQEAVAANFVQVDGTLESLVQRFWEWDAVLDTGEQLSVNDKRVLDLWNNTSAKEDGHYKLPIPFKGEPNKLPNNYSAARVRLDALGRKLGKDPEMFNKYKEGIKELVEKGYAERVSEENKEAAWYLPHHAVISDKKPDKIRIVFDCAARYGNTSLNSEVYQGPDLTNSLIGVLLRFRQDRIAITGDIDAMFHQVKVEERHRNVLRFLWWKNDNMALEPEIFRMTSHLFGGVWSPSAANYALRKTADDNRDHFTDEVVQTVYKDFYVDDCLQSLGSEAQAITRINDLTKLLQRGGFRIRKWLSNSRSVLESVPKEDRAKNVKDIDLVTSQLPQEKALGVMWNTETDNLTFKFTPKCKPSTKRGLLSIISSLYDPLGFLCPLVLQAKKIFQNECKENKEWDSPLEKSNADEWAKWQAELPKIIDFSVPRCIVPNHLEEIVSSELHHFADASMSGYGAVAYLRLVDMSGKIHCSFLMGKARLAPMKSVTIPRLELSAAVLSVKLDQTLRKELNVKIDRSNFWTDSTIVLYYIRSNTQRYQTFVANRVSQIHELSSADDWHHVESGENPADRASRGLNAEQMMEDKLWIQGPGFIWRDKSEWPQTCDVIDVKPDNLELRKVKANLVEVKEIETCTERLLKKYSSWYRLKRAVAWILRLKVCLIERVKSDKRKSCVSLESLSVSEIKQAEEEIVKYVQACEFSGELNCITQDKAVKQTSKIQNLDPIVNTQGILCVGGRLRNAALPDLVKHQMIMPKSHHVVNLIVREMHERLGHSGKEHVLSEIRQKFWIVSGRRAVKSVLSQCISCKRARGKQCIQKMADLPADRVTAGKPPFSHVGVDCFGPFVIKRGRCEVKRYGCLFTCLCTRAIHIEKLDSMDTASFINALRRFESRRGTPEIIRSDNGSNFKGAQRELKESIKSWNKDKIKEHMIQREIKWVFNPPAASHMGGVWERQIRTVRKVLNSLSGPQGLSDEGLNTLFCEAEAIVNSRPITVVSDKPDDLEPLTPNHLLRLRSGDVLPAGEFDIKDTYRKQWKHTQFLVDRFWERWLKEYLPSLQMRQKWDNKVENISEGDIVTLLDEQSPRNKWPLGRVVRTLPGRDGLVRTVEIRTGNTTLMRPVHKLCLIESVTM